MDKALDYRFRTGASVNIVLVTDEDRDNSDSSLTSSSILSKFTTKNALLNAVVNSKLEDSAGKAAVGVDSKGNAYLPDGTGGFIKTTGGAVVSAAGTTKANYIDLAWDTQSEDAGGAVWDLNQLRGGGLVADSFSSAFAEVKVKEVLESFVILGEEGVFEVCANNEGGTRVLTREESGSDYLFIPSTSDRWSPGEENDFKFYGYEGSSDVFGALLTDIRWDAYSLIADDGKIENLSYQLSLNPELPVYYRDPLVFKMNAAPSHYEDNVGCITVRYENMGALPN